MTGAAKEQRQTDTWTHTKGGWDDLGSSPEAQPLYFMELGREVRLLNTTEERSGVIADKQRGGVYGVELHQGDRLRSSKWDQSL